jgi:hypothetical protein
MAMPKPPKSKSSNRSANRPKPPKRPIRPEDRGDLIMTPGGLRPRSLVHQLKPGEHVSLKGGRIRIIETATGNVVKDLGESAKPGEDEKPIPRASGPLPGPSGPVAATSDVGWIEDSQWWNDTGQPIVYFSTKWIVPPAPSADDSQTVFLFNGMQPDSAAHILQPVLQWGSSGAGGSNTWQITNWYADGQGGAAVFGSLVSVNPGDELQGIMTCTGQSASGFNYTSSFVGHSTTDISVTDVEELTWAFETLECYGSSSSTPLAQCADYPDTTLTAMYDIEIKTGTPGTAGTDAAIDWFAVTNFTDCGQSCQIVSNDSPGGAVYLYYRSPAQNFYFIVDKGTFGKDEVADVIAHSGGVYTAAVYLALEGFTLEQLTIDQPSIIEPNLSGAFTTFSSGVHVVPSMTYPPIYDAGNEHVPQRILFPFDVTFNQNAHDNDFPASGTQGEELDAAITIGGVAFNASTEMFLVAGADPYFNNIDPDQGNVFYLSQDLRVFTVTPEANNATPIGTVPFTFQGGGPTSLDSPAAYSYIQNLIGYFNSTYSDPAGADPFKPSSAVLPGHAGVYTGDSTVTPALPNPGDPAHPFRSYNFALARVRLRGTSGTPGQAADTRVFFRVFTTQTFDTDYINVASAVTAGDPNITYPSLPAGSPDAPTSPLPGTDAGGTINGCTLPFFAAADMSDLGGGVNDQTIIIPSGRNRTWAYFGCYLNVYDNSVSIGGHDPQFWLAGSTHNCIVAQIAYSDTPIKNLNGIIENPENSSLLAQRNLQITPSGNPGYPETHLVPQTFDTRPSPPPTGGMLGNYPDELMIDWRNTPRGSTADIYWPTVEATEVVAAAASLYPSSTLAVVDSHTIRCTVGAGMTFVPIPRGGNESFAGLVTIQLPNGIKAGKAFDIVIRRVTSRRLDRNVVAVRSKKGEAPRLFEWRYVVGTFQMTIPVEHDATILAAEENLLAILKWRLTWLDQKSRWYPILVRYLSYVIDRVRGFGGNPDHIKPSLLGTANQGKPVMLHPIGEKRLEWTGKICGIRYNRFGDFIGFDLITLAGEERSFRGREPEIEELVRVAWRERILLTVFGSKHDHEWPAEIVLLRPPHMH